MGVDKESSQRGESGSRPGVKNNSKSTQDPNIPGVLRNGRDTGNAQQEGSQAIKVEQGLVHDIGSAMGSTFIEKEGEDEEACSCQKHQMSQNYKPFHKPEFDRSSVSDSSLSTDLFLLRHVLDLFQSYCFIYFFSVML